MPSIYDYTKEELEAIYARVDAFFNFDGVKLDEQDDQTKAVVNSLKLHVQDDK